MKSVVSRRSRQNALLLAAAFGLALASGGAAQAFTFTDQNGGESGNGSMFLDRDSTGQQRSDQPTARFGNGNGNGNTTIQQGNGLRFGGNGGSFNQRYNPNYLFDPYARDGR